MTAFGERLCRLRKECRDPTNGRVLSQKRLGELLQDECGRYFSGAAVHYWERGESKIHKDDRLLLIAILKALYKNGGLKTLSDAESLLEAGNYRALNENEKQQVFPKDLLKTSIELTIGQLQEETPSVKPPLGNISSISGFQSLVDQAKEGPPPAWPRVAAAVMRRLSDRMEASNPARALIWLPVWILAYVLLNPALQWPFPSREVASDSIVVYIYASFALPLCIGLLRNTDRNVVWKGREKASPTIVRLYTYQGAFIGFHVGYFAVFAIHLVASYFQLNLPHWFHFALAGLPLFMGTVGAHLVPDNLWRAYGQLSLRDGAIFFAFIPLGPLWGWFFLRYYSWLTSPIMGTAIIITALILAAGLTGRKSAGDSTH